MASEPTESTKLVHRSDCGRVVSELGFSLGRKVRVRTFSLAIVHHLGGFPMEILLFDSGSESAQVWTRLAHSHHLPLEINASWHGPERVSETAILVLDQSAFASGFARSIASLAHRRPHQVIVATGASLSVMQVAEIMRAGVDFVYEKPLNAKLIDCSMPEILTSARRLRVEREEFQNLKLLFEKLTSRERDVLGYVLDGVPNKKTAEELSVSVRTIEARRAKVYDKTQSSCVVELVRKVDRLARLSRFFEVQEPSLATASSADGNPPKKFPAPRFERGRIDDEGGQGSRRKRRGYGDVGPRSPHGLTERTALAAALQASKQVRP